MVSRLRNQIRPAVPLWLTSRVTDGTTVYDALEKGLDDLMDLCDVVEMKFAAARDDYVAQMET